MQKLAGLFTVLIFLGMACVSPGAESPAVAGDAAAPGKAGPPNAAAPAPSSEVIHLDRIYLRDGEVKTGRELACRNGTIVMTSAGIERSYKVEAIDTIESVTKDSAFWMSVTELALRKGNGRLAFNAAFQGQRLHDAKAPFVAVLQSPNFSRLAISLESADAAVDTLRKVRDRVAEDRNGLVARIRAAEQDMDQITARMYGRLNGPPGRTVLPGSSLMNTCPTCGGSGFIMVPANTPAVAPQGGIMAARAPDRGRTPANFVVCPTCGGTGLIPSVGQPLVTLPDYQPNTTAEQLALRNEVANEHSLLGELKKANVRLQPIEEELAAAVKQRGETEAKLREECPAIWTRVFAPPDLREEKKPPVPDAPTMPPAGQVIP